MGRYWMRLRRYSSLKDVDSSVKGDGEISLKTGDNEIVLTVTAQNGEEKTD